MTDTLMNDDNNERDFGLSDEADVDRLSNDYDTDLNENEDRDLYKEDNDADMSDKVKDKFNEIRNKMSDDRP